MKFPLSKRGGYVLGGIVSLFLVVFIGAALIFFSFLNTPRDMKAEAVVNPVNVSLPEEKLQKPLRILLLGVDDGDPDNPKSPKRSDTMLVASIDPGGKSLSLLSIPRDSKVNIPGHSGDDKITHAFFYGGPALAVQTVEENFQMPIDYYVVIDWQAFIKVIDIIGGVNLEVEENMDYEDPYENLRIHLAKGFQHLNGEQAGQYVRFRHDELGDIGRVERQEHFFHALADKMLQPATILKLPALFATVSHYVQTNMEPYTLLKTANLLKEVHSDAVHTVMAPGRFATIDGVSYWVLEKQTDIP